MSGGGRPTLTLTRRTPLKTRKNPVASSGKKKNGNLSESSPPMSSCPHMYFIAVISSNSNNKVWVDTVTDLNQYKASAEELEARKLARKSNNKLLAKVNPPKPRLECDMS